MIRAGLLVASVSRMGGGVSESVRRLGLALQTEPIGVEVLSLIDEWTAADAPAWRPLALHLAATRGPRSFGYSRELLRQMLSLDLDVLHVHGIWMYPDLCTVRWQARTRRPYVVSPHGMLDAWALAHSRWKKTLAHALYAGALLRSAACLRALCVAEAEAMRAYGLRSPICVVPNGTDVQTAASTAPPPWEGRIERGRRVLLYLGRLHPKKGLPKLLLAWQRASRISSSEARNWSLAIAGWGPGGHETELKTLARDLGLEDSVCFLGPLFEQSRNAAYGHASAFVLPSLSEGLPMAVLEAWSHALPVLMTAQCNLPEGFSAGAALEIGPEPASIAAAICELRLMTDAERGEIGARGRNLVQERFAWPRIAADTHAVYRWLLGGGPPPACVWPR